MLKELIVKNIVLIESIKIEFKKGLSVLTGETGTGKSILLDSLGLIVGNRVDFNLIRHGETDASVTAIFQINEKHPVIKVIQRYDIEFEDELIIRRHIKADGKSKCLVNDTIITRSALIEITDHLIEIQGQFDDRGLLDIKTHLSLLDDYSNHDKLIEDTKISFTEMKKIKNFIKEIEMNEKKLNEDREWIKDSLDQLVILDPKIGEEIELNQTKKLLSNREKIYNTIIKTKSIIEDENGLEDLINKLLKEYDDLKSYEQPNLVEAIDSILRTKAEIEEIKRFANNQSMNLNEKTDDLETINDRLHELRSQARKHKCEVDDLIKIKIELEEKLEEINKNSSNLNDLIDKHIKAKENFKLNSKRLSESRKKSAIKLSQKINEELPYLKLGNANFEIKFEDIDFESCSIDGIDKVIFFASTNTGIDKKPINKIASGGELSRFLLAIKVVLETEIQNRTIIFDEIDSGIGGSAANAVGLRLAKLGKTYQTMVVTHSPQVTSKGHNHYLIKKQDIQNKTISNVTELNINERVEEIARMVSGQAITNEAREAAQKLLDN